MQPPCYASIEFIEQWFQKICREILHNTCHFSVFGVTCPRFISLSTASMKRRGKMYGW